MVEKLTDVSINQFLDDLASSKPAPGGGSVAALAGALGAALLSMVGNLTIGKKKYEDVQEEITALVARTEKLRRELTFLLEEDVRVYTELSQIMKMPRETDEQKASREKSMDKALKAAAGVPMKVAETCVSVMDLCGIVAEKGNVNAVSDAGVGVLLAEAGLKSAALNVYINLGYIKDEVFIKETRDHLDIMLDGKQELREEVYNLVVSKL